MSEEIQEERWKASEGALENGLPFTLRFREDLPGESVMKRLSTLMVVSWTFDSPDDRGMPSEEELDRMERFEALTDEHLVERGVARLMTVFTGDGVREWQFYTADPEIFMEKLNAALKNEPVMPLDIEAFDDENWDGYKDYTNPGLINKK
jgi:Family of unknown function (DUF695).